MNIKRIGKAIMVLLLATPALSSMELMAQNLKMPTLEDLLPGGATYRIAENLPGLQWWGDVCIKPGIDSLFAVNPKNGKETLLTTREKVNKVLNSLITPTETTATPGHKGNKVQHFYNTEFPWPDKPYMLIKLPARYIVYDFEKDEFVKGLPQAGERNGANIDYTPEGGHIAYTVKNNLFVDNKAVTEEPEGIVCGQSVHRNEFGIGKGTFWSPQGNLLAFYRMNESMVTPYPLVDITPRIALVDKIRYPMAGMLSHQVTVGIYNPDTQKTVYLNTGDPTNRYFTNISWAPDGKSLYLIELNRDQNHAKLCRYNSETGELMSTLIEETHPKYVEPQQPILFLPWDHTQFIYQSQKDGYNHLQYGRQAHQATDKRGVAGTKHFRIQCQKERGYHRFYGSISFAKQPVQGQCQYRQTYSIGQQQGSTQRDTFRFGQLYYRPVFNSGYSPQNRDNQYPKQEKRLFAHCEESL